MKPLSCPLCCKLKFASTKDLMYHLERIRNNLTCPLCSAWCSDIQELIHHLNECSNSGLKHLSNTNNESRQANRESDEDDDDDDDSQGFFCTVCNLKISSVNEHVQQYHSGQEVILQENEDDEEETPSVHTGNIKGSNIKKEKEDRGKRISVPNGDFKTLNDSKEEEEDEQFYCTDCDFSFVSLKNHMSMYHEDEQLVLKEISDNLLGGENSTEGKNVCTYCGKRFKARSALTNHRKIHMMKDGRKLSTFRRPNGSLTKKRVYKRRLINKNKSMEESQYDLGNVEQLYQSGMDPSHDEIEQEAISKPNNNVIKHKVRTNLSMLKKNAKLRNNLKIRLPKYMLDKTKENEESKAKEVSVKKEGAEEEEEEEEEDENPLKCKVCKRLVLSKPALIQHMRKHPGEGAYKCKECHMKFTHLSTYINHTRLHTGRYPHYCSYCKRGFSYVSTLRVHMKKHNIKAGTFN